ncbi:MAG: hypothetical protein HY705_07425 [Gemmatimonadetes bacterium]|nr:hypothetical protein [Gemmatimonadota bacterium]
MELWDCSAFTQSMFSTTANPQLAASFTALRASAGVEYRTQEVPDAQARDCDLQYACNGEFEDGAVFKAQEMEDKWDIYLYRPYLFFARSWSGQLTYRATVAFEQGHVRVSRVECPAAEEPEFARRVVDYLIRSHLLGFQVPHPLPADLPAEPEKIAATSFSLFGRRCLYGSYADTTLVRASAP